MCYYLYGSLNGEVPENEYANVLNRYSFKISLGTKHDLKNAVNAAAESVRDDFRVTDWICDCESPVGNHYSNDPVIVELSNLITDLAALPGAEQIYICKTWVGKRNKKEITVNPKDLDLPAFLADVRENTLYCLDL